MYGVFVIFVICNIFGSLTFKYLYYTCEVLQAKKMFLPRIHIWRRIQTQAKGQEQLLEATAVESSHVPVAMGM